MLYLHEIIDIIGTGQEPYMRSVIERAKHSEREGISRLMGCWKVIGSTGRWPRVVNLWEMDDWTHWARALERQFLPERRDPSLQPWWTQATEWRRGGFDRILVPAPYAPRRSDLQAASLRAWVFIHTIARLRPGAAREYLEQLGALLRPECERRGVSLFGAYYAPMRRGEVVVIWAARDFAHACAIYSWLDEDHQLDHWRALEDKLLRRSATVWLVPAEDCFFHPQSRTG